VVDPNFPVAVAARPNRNFQIKRSHPTLKHLAWLSIANAARRPDQVESRHALRLMAVQAGGFLKAM
jgi:hypothetical protein